MARTPTHIARVLASTSAWQAMVSLTWTSMNIDAFLARFHQELVRFADLVSKMRDIMDNRIARNLSAVSRLLLVELPHDESMTLDKFVSVQVTIAPAPLRCPSAACPRAPRGCLCPLPSPAFCGGR